jgi:hypothetical protein
VNRIRIEMDADGSISIDIVPLEWVEWYEDDDPPGEEVPEEEEDDYMEVTPHRQPYYTADTSTVIPLRIAAEDT